MVLAAFVYYVNNKITSVVEIIITFVDESQNFDFEKHRSLARTTMGMRFKNNFTVWREVLN